MINASMSVNSPQSGKDLLNDSRIHKSPQEQARRCQMCPSRGLGFGYPAADRVSSQVTRTQMGKRQSTVSHGSR